MTAEAACEYFMQLMCPLVAGLSTNHIESIPFVASKVEKMLVQLESKYDT